MGCNASSQRDLVEEVVLPSHHKGKLGPEKELKNVVCDDQAPACSVAKRQTGGDSHSLERGELSRSGSRKSSNGASYNNITQASSFGEDKPSWSRKVLSSGADKDIYAGTFKGRKVAVCVSKPRGSGITRIQNEITVFRALGKHPHIVEMYYNGMTKGLVYFALEVVEPIGYDLDRLKNMYSFAGQTLPSSLMARVFHQLVSALGHMHKNGYIHRDLKTENVLINAKHEAKLIDMGIACKVGTRDLLRAGYLAPELCEGRKPLGVEVDSWGLGIILHQVYQNQWKVLTDAGPVKLLPNRPSASRPMEGSMREAMTGLLQFSPEKRWTLPRLLECDWLARPLSPSASTDWQSPCSKGEEYERRYLRRYTSPRPLPTALAVFISRKNHEHLLGQPIRALGLSSGLGITVLLINYANGGFERVPGAQTPIVENSWVYFGVPPGEDSLPKAVAGLEKVLSLRKSRESQNSTFRALNKHEVIETGKLVEFTVEFDCFSFPSHIGAEAAIGPCSVGGGNSSADVSERSDGSNLGGGSVDARPAGAGGALDLRRAFQINLVGIHREGEEEPEWFPRASAVVRPDDLGLVVRLPCMDGSTQATLTDEDLQAFMDKDIFGNRCRERRYSSGAESPTAVTPGTGFGEAERRSIAKLRSSSSRGTSRSREVVHVEVVH